MKSSLFLLSSRMVFALRCLYTHNPSCGLGWYENKPPLRLLGGVSQCHLLMFCIQSINFVNNLWALPFNLWEWPIEVRINSNFETMHYMLVLEMRNKEQLIFAVIMYRPAMHR